MIRVRPVISEEQYYAVLRPARKFGASREDARYFRVALETILSQFTTKDEEQ